MSPAAEMLIDELRRRGRLAANDVIRRNAHAFSGASEIDRLRAESIAHAVAMRLLEDALVRIASLDADGEAYEISVVRELFGLTEPAEPPARVS